MPYTIALPSDPTAWISDAKKHLEISQTDKSHDSHLCKLIELAVENVQTDSNRAVCTQTVTLNLDRFPGGNRIDIPFGQLATVTSLAYLDTEGNSQTWASSNYEVDTARDAGCVWLAYNISWPSIRSIQNAVTLTYTAGHATSDIPRVAWEAVMLQVAHAFENREPILVGSMSKELELSYMACVNRFALGDAVVI